MQILVILSVATASQSEAVAESKDPLPARSATSSARSFNYALATRTGNWQLGTGN
jgi:hypothetical protein